MIKTSHLKLKPNPHTQPPEPETKSKTFKQKAKQYQNELITSLIIALTAIALTVFITPLAGLFETPALIILTQRAWLNIGED